MTILLVHRRLVPHTPWLSCLQEQPSQEYREVVRLEKHSILICIQTASENRKHRFASSILPGSEALLGNSNYRKAQALVETSKTSENVEEKWIHMSSIAAGGLSHST